MSIAESSHRMEIQKHISDILEGKARVLSFDNVALGPDKDIAAGVLCALNFVRLAFATVESTPLLSKVLTHLCSGETVDVRLAFPSTHLLSTLRRPECTCGLSRMAQ